MNQISYEKEVSDLNEVEDKDINESVNSNKPTVGDMYGLEWVLLSKTQKKRRIAKAKGKEINKGINIKVGYPEG